MTVFTSKALSSLSAHVSSEEESFVVFVLFCFYYVDGQRSTVNGPVFRAIGDTDLVRPPLTKLE